MENSALNICKSLQEAGYEAYFAGGAVRDMLRSHPPEDFDIATSASPDEIEAVFDEHHFIPVGRDFGVMIMNHNGHQFEIATFRQDSDDSDGRRPSSIAFSSAEIDAQRRDFTINGIFYDPVAQCYIDYVGGRHDLESEVLRFIGNPEKRILEDHLRMLRAVRFKNRFDLHYEDSAIAAIKEWAFKINNISHERICAELDKMFASPRREQCLRDLFELGLLHQVLPEVAALADFEPGHAVARDGESIFDNICRAIRACHLNADLDLVWAVLLHDIAKARTEIKQHDEASYPHHAQVGATMANEICRRLKFSNERRKKVVWIIEHHMSAGDVLNAPLATRRRYFMHDYFADFLEFVRIDEASYEGYDLSYYHKLKELYDADHTILLPGLEPLLNGREVMEILQMRGGPELRKILDALWDAQLEENVKTKDEAVAFIKKIQ